VLVEFLAKGEGRFQPLQRKATRQGVPRGSSRHSKKAQFGALAEK
jgi:hypothetical protein